MIPRRIFWLFDVLMLGFAFLSYESWVIEGMAD